MRTGRIVLYGLLGTLATFWAASCQGPQEFFRDNALSTGTGGLPGTGGAAGSSGGKNCVDAIKLAGYSAGGQACSACKENGADKSVPCKAVIDCLDTNYPCGSANNCALQCNNSGGADSIVSGCVSALLSAAACM